jgi:hypothetical protein
MPGAMPTLVAGVLQWGHDAMVICPHPNPLPEGEGTFDPRHLPEGEGTFLSTVAHPGDEIRRLRDARCGREIY